MRNVPVGLAGHLRQEVKTLATCIKIVRVDGVGLYYTDHDEPLELLGNTYLANVGYNRTVIDNSAVMNVDNVDLTGFVNALGISEIDIRNKLYDFAEITMYLVNWMNIADGYAILKRGNIGDINLTNDDQYVAEVRGLSQHLVKILGTKYQPECRADLGNISSSECKMPIQPPLIRRNTSYSVGEWVRAVINSGLATQDRYANRIYECIEAGATAAVQSAYSTTIGNSVIDGGATFKVHDSWTKHGTVGVVTDRQNFQLTTTPSTRAYESRTAPTSGLKYYRDLPVLQPVDLQETWFNGGALHWETGKNVGLTQEIKSWNQATAGIELFLPTNYDIQLGDKIWLYPGCDKRRLTCVDKFRMIGSKDYANGNLLNFRGEPDLPGRDLLLRTPDAK